ncbi:hypothetical protein OROMI_015163 [Orobanche minor]
MDKIAKLTGFRKRILTDITRAENPDIDEPDLDIAIKDIDQITSIVGARVWDNIYPTKGSRFRTPMMGAEGHRLLKDTPCFQRNRKGDVVVLF